MEPIHIAVIWAGSANVFDMALGGAAVSVMGTSTLRTR